MAQVHVKIRNHHNCTADSPIEQQIVSVADICSALTEERPYKKSLSKNPEFIKSLTVTQVYL